MDKHVRRRPIWAVVLIGMLAAACGGSGSSSSSSSAGWVTIADNADLVPGTSRFFNGYNQPSVSAYGVVVFRGRTVGPNPVHGIYERQMDYPERLGVVAVNRITAVPSPNNTGSTFIEFPSFPRIGVHFNAVVTRGESQPVWNYTLPDGTATQLGTSGVYTSAASGLVTGASQLGAVPGMEYFQVPGAAPGTRFDQFPGSPSITQGHIIVFKGNYTDGAGNAQTGVYYRDVLADSGHSPVELIADSTMPIPGGTANFGSTAPPSAANGEAVFLGLDNEASPTQGAIYLASLTPNPLLQPLVFIGEQVPGEAAGTVFNRLGEALSFDGRYVGFWGAWGTETMSVTVQCAAEGNKARLAYCVQQSPNGDGIYTQQDPVHQGFFVYDIQTGQLATIAKTGSEFSDFVYWNFSGRVPGTGSPSEGDFEDFEPARWRYSSFIAVSARGNGFQAAFKATTTAAPPVNGIYLAQSSTMVVTPILDTTMSGEVLDPAAPADSTISELGLERDGLRGGWLAVSAKMLEPGETGASESEGWAGVYVIRLGM